MILGRLADRARYEGMNPLFKAAFDFLEGAAALDNGRYELGNGMYVNIADVTTRPADSFDFEAHKRYIDIQCLLGGHSVLTWARTEELTVTVPYDAAKDAMFLTGQGRGVQVEQGDFYILWPEDAHKPHGTDGEASAYRNVVVKVPLDK